MKQLAVNGGKPVRDTFLPYARQQIDTSDINAVIETLQSDFLTTGPQIGEFEKALGAVTGAKYNVAVSNGTAALHIACMAAGVQSGWEVITSALTFAASANCVLYCGGTPVFADINPRTYNIDPKEIERRLTPRTKAIIPVHYTGEPCEMEEINAMARARGLVVIQDASHALGGAYQGQKLGNISHMACFSFHAVKNITTGEGGAVATDDEQLYHKLLLYRSHGITREPGLLSQEPGPWYYEQLDLGYNYRMTDIQCALGLSQLSKLDGWNRRRQEIADFYNEQFAKMDSVQIRNGLKNAKSGNHLYILRLEPEKLTVDRNTVFQALRCENIGVNLHYIPVYLHPYYQKLGYPKGLCTNAEYLYERMFTIPLFPGMTDGDAEDVVKAVKKVTEAYQK